MLTLRLPRAIRGAALAGLLGLAGCSAAGAPALALADAAAGVIDELLTPASPAELAAANGTPLSPMQSAIQSRSKQRAMTVAQREARRHGWPGVSIVDSSFANGRWAISLMRLPTQPNGHAIAEVSAEGELLDFTIEDS